MRDRIFDGIIIAIVFIFAKSGCSGNISYVNSNAVESLVVNESSKNNNVIAGLVKPEALLFVLAEVRDEIFYDISLSIVKIF